MKKLTIYQIEEKEAKFIKICLNYVFHRLYRHGKKIPFIKLQEINKLRKQLGGNEKKYKNMTTISRTKLNKYDLIEIIWLDSHCKGGWNTPDDVNRWIEEADDTMKIKTIGYFIHEDKNFIRICQSHYFQHHRENTEGDNMYALFAIAKPCILDIVKK